ncbi:hypothetical protein GYMLUDRAFT_48778 [Collybiopsis luxurians FD-317 M1]|uniref:Uncharacterized protein n=1 Tax=Collybiopsis luxurians FD-317 M1 TaxID=944289 RepID=A0A0D0CHM0_9AGAR|nr:hypothetical protein GYMLUDRAFT_48778 [Collybiopsis luxurians FD-317 M1]
MPYNSPPRAVHIAHLNDLDTSYDADYDCDSNFEFDGVYMPKQSIRAPSPLSLSLISESKITKGEPQHSSSYMSSYSNTSSSSSGASTSSRGIERYGRRRRYHGRSGKDTDLYGYAYDEEEEDEMELSDEGYDSYDASPRFRSQLRLTRRTRTASPPRSPIFAYSSPLPSGSSPSFPLSYSLSHPEELEGEAETPFPDSNSTHDTELEHTPSCNETIRRQWQAFLLRVQFGVFRTRRRIRGIIGRGRKY